eukprot:jgi/Tetstr1/428769/TSEL_018757.t1
MIDFACVSSTTPTWSNDPRWCIPGIAATEAEHAKLAADRASSAPVQGVHRYYPFVVEDRGRLGKSALTVVYIFAVLLAEDTSRRGARRQALRALVYSHFFDTTTAAKRSNNGVDGLFNAMDDRRLEVRLHQAAKALQADAQLKGGGGGRGGGGGGNSRTKEQERAERTTKERADKNKDNGKIQPGNPAKKTTSEEEDATPHIEEQS